MKYKLIKYKQKKKCPLETYEPKKRIRISRENTVPWIIRIGNKFIVLGGLIGFWASGFLIILRGVFGAEEKLKKSIRRFSANNRVVELKLKKNKAS